VVSSVAKPCLEQSSSQNENYTVHAVQCRYCGSVGRPSGGHFLGFHRKDATCGISGAEIGVEARSTLPC